MSVFELTPASPRPPRLSARAPAAIGLFTGEDFEHAQVNVADLSQFIDYDDWLDRQQGLQIGLDMVGVTATLVRIDLASFLEWRRLTGMDPDQGALDAFAAVTLAMRTALISKVLAAISESDFARHAAAFVAIAGGRDYDRWTRYRRSLRVKIETLGGRVEQMPISLEDFAAWCSCLDQAASEQMLDRFAQLTLERLTTPGP